MEGATTEHGPLVLFDIKESILGSSGQLSANPCASRCRWCVCAACSAY